ncbi:type IV toxin-antitoxin system AbiEi family antitoxin domain-containing protein [Williamsia sp. CHRR-6]|uniref:type IV toxin-antitoxin system AbiEi family antitoxin domain-containing protein n=1 Tax=Williamsia sp. CHRR-6 TaxID=2835871 RepID=UPI001BD9CC54|nr:type IV toxin-antitoxin system AbiEi family antitoxin domain-containing protein [Williamsia sp. CHRR-6]MBT0565494.1 type IV toxin-antitoxin system AbiEi family antitoxin domain-containing protein [Williamsia sp. CHRR-6]
MDARNARLVRLLDDQDGLFTQKQVAPLGYPWSRVRHHIDTGRWVRVLHGVYSASAGPLTRGRLLRAALLYGGSSSVLSHDTAAEEWGLTRVDGRVAMSDPIHITVPYGRSAVNAEPTTLSAAVHGGHPVSGVGEVIHPGVAVHRSRAMNHIVHASVLPRTSLADTALDIATAADTPRAAMTSLVGSLTSRRVSLHDIRDRIEKRPPFRYRKQIDDAVQWVADGVQSVLELRYVLDVELAHGLPSGKKQSPVAVDGRTLYEDVDYTPHGVPLIVRLDGQQFHSSAGVVFRDRRRDNAAELADRPRLVFGWQDVDSDPCAVARDVAQVLRREGWTGSMHPCARE